eukprot:1286996-Rhodomonas_salina.2
MRIQFWSFWDLDASRDCGEKKKVFPRCTMHIPYPAMRPYTYYYMNYRTKFYVPTPRATGEPQVPSQLKSGCTAVLLLVLPGTKHFCTYYEW